MQVPLAELVAFLEYCTRQRMLYAGRWIGQRVRLKAALGALPAPSEGRFLLHAGAVRWIVRLQLDAQTPFIVEFPGFPYRVAPLLVKLDFLDLEGPTQDR